MTRLRTGLPFLVALGAAGVAGIGLVASPHWVLAGILLLGFSVGCALKPGLAIPALLVYATTLGFLRRYVAQTFDSSPAFDPLIIVLPVAALVLGGLAISRGALQHRTVLTNSVLVLVVLSVVGVLNPLQGSLLTGIGGLAFFGAPFAWYFVGRVLATDQIMSRAYLWVGVTVLASSFYGLAQSYGTFTSFDRTWSESTNFQLGGELRPFGWSSSPGEYARMLAIASVIFIAATGHSRMRTSRWIVLPALLAPLLLALTLTSVRSTIVYFVLAVSIAAAASRGASVRTIIGLGALGLVVLWAGVSTLGGSFTEGSSNIVIARQVEGLSDPTNSTATARFELLGQAMVDSIGRPMGLGTGVTTRASAANDSRPIITESDLGDAAVSWGLAGVAALCVFLIAAFATLMQLARRERGWLSQAALAVFVVATLRWINGGLYAVAPLVLLSIGWADRKLADARVSPASEPPGNDMSKLDAAPA